MKQSKRQIAKADMGYHIATEPHFTSADVTVRENGVLLGRFFNRTEAHQWTEDRESAIRRGMLKLAPALRFQQLLSKHRIDNMKFLNVDTVRKQRSEGSTYAAVAKVEPSTKATALCTACNALRHEILRGRVAYVITQAIYNADDTNVDGYRGSGFDSRIAFWAHMFKSSAECLAADQTDKRVAKFFNSRGFHV